MYYGIVQKNTQYIILKMRWIDLLTQRRDLQVDITHVGIHAQHLSQAGLLPHSVQDIPSLHMVTRDMLRTHEGK